KPLAAVADDGRDVGEGLDVVDERGLAEEAADRRVGRARPGRAALALDGGQQRRLLAADKGSCAEADFNVEVKRSVADAVAQQSASPGLANSCGQTGDGH